MKNISIRPCELTDDLAAVTDLIVATDDYIYPPMFQKDPRAKYDFFEACFRDENSLFSCKNIRLAFRDSRIVGILVAFDGGRKYVLGGAASTGLCHADIQYCDQHYFQPLLDTYKQKTDCSYISNLCVSACARNSGIGTALMHNYLQHCQKRVELDVLCDNAVALRLYQNCDFRILYSEDAFAFEQIPDFRSYRMQRG